MIKTFFLMAMLTMPNGEVKNHPHIGYEFKSLDECHSFLNKNALTISIQMGLWNQPQVHIQNILHLIFLNFAWQVFFLPLIQRLLTFD